MSTFSGLDALEGVSRDPLYPAPGEEGDLLAWATTFRGSVMKDRRDWWDSIRKILGGDQAFESPEVNSSYTPTRDVQLTNKEYVDDAIAASGMPSGVDGDILYYETSWKKLAKGDDEDALRQVGGVPTWQPGFKSAFYAVQSNQQSFSSSTLVWNGTGYDRNNDFDIANNYFVVPVTGIYTFHVSVGFINTASAGVVGAYIHAGSVKARTLVDYLSGQSGIINVSATLSLTAGTHVLALWSAPTVTDKTTGETTDTFFTGFGPL